MTPTMVDAAIWYATRRPGGVEWPMFGVGRNKAPICKRGVYAGTTDPAALRSMFAADPYANPAVRCEHVAVLDIDPRNGGHLTVNHWGERHGDFPKTWEDETGAKGTHLYFQPSKLLEGVPLGKIAPGVDYKGNGKHYVLVPPSVSTSGRYRWRVKPTECELAPAPDWLIAHILKVKQKPERKSEPVDTSKYDGIDRVERARTYAAKLPGAVSGQDGHSTTIRTCCLIARGFALTKDEAFSVLSVWNRNECKPPWSDADLKRKIAQTLDHGDATMGFLLNRGRRAA